MIKMLSNYKHFRISALNVTEAEKNEPLIKKLDQIHFYHNTPKDLLWKKHLEKNYTYKELATCMSHLKAIRTAYKNGDDIALVLEDDVMLDDRFVETSWDLVSAAPKNWEVLQLYVQHPKMVGHFNHLLDPWIFWQSKNWAASAYFINRKGMEKLLQIMYRGPDMFFRTQNP